MLSGRRIVAILLIAIGAFLAINPNALATIVIDTTPPMRIDSVPINQGGYGQITEIWIKVKDPVSGVASVAFWDSYTGQTRGLTLSQGDIYEGIWKASVSGVKWPVDQWISFKFLVDDYAGNRLTYAGDFRILNLKGYWEVTDGVNTYRSDLNWDNIVFKSNTLTFRFHETQGDAVEVSVTYTQIRGGSAVGSVKMERVGIDLWEGTKTFQDGVYNIQMVASDGVSEPIVASIIAVGNPEGSPMAKVFSGSNLYRFVGLAMIGVGLLLFRRGEENGEE